MRIKIEKNVEFRIHRFNPLNQKKYVSTFKVPIYKGTTVLESLKYIRDNFDATLTFRHSCRMGICGSCGLNVNGKPMLACYTQVLDLETEKLVIEPLANLPIIKDLIVDIDPFFDTIKKINPSLIKEEEELKKPTEFIQYATDLKKYWDLTLCTKCSICYSACPAVLDEKFLGPSALTTNYRFISDSRDEGLKKRITPMIDNIWLCTSCNSCTLFCPKLVDCSNSIMEERGIIVESGRIPKTVQDVLESVFKYNNPMGTGQSKRMDWAKGLKVKTYPQVTKADVLYFVCCSTAYDERNQEIARAMTLVFDKLNIEYATLGKEEWCCGDHMLRMGEKGLFEMLAEHNVSLFKKFDAKKIVTLSPHCYNTFKNDKLYKDIDKTIQHYTEFLAESIVNGKLEPTKNIKEKVTYHDPCFLGKRNEVYDAPRQILHSIKGLELVEMKRTKECSFCCGGGGGRVWTEEALPEKRSSVSRIQEAFELGVDTIAVACPFCITTLEDAIKVLDLDGKIKVKDILEILVEAL